MSELSDEEITKKIKEGDVEKFAILVERYESKIQRYLSKFLYQYEDTQDTLQDVFIKAFTNMQSFDSNRRFSPWIYRIAHNTAISKIKKKAKEPIPFFDPDTLFPHPVAKQKTDKHTELQEIKSALDTCLSQLKPNYREPIILYFFEDMSYQEISDIMHIPTTTVGVRINRAKKKLKELYDQK